MKIVTAACVFVAWFGAPAFAGSLSVGPTRVELSDRHRIEIVTIRNTGSENTVVQLDTAAWSRDEAGDHLDETSDLVATPAVFELKPGQQRQIRVGMRDPLRLGSQASYRLYLRELHPTTGTGNATLQFALRIGVPVYVGGITTPLKPSARVSAAPE